MFVIGLCLIVYGCVENKYGSTQSVISRMYFNTTGRYNSYYYGDQKLTREEQKYTKTYKDNYNKLLPVFIEPVSASNDKPNKIFDSVIQKMSYVIQLNTTPKNQPMTKWIDDCYFDMGKAYYYQGKYDDAVQTFEYVSTGFKNHNNYNSKGKPKKVNYRRLNQKREKAKEDNVTDDATVNLVPQQQSFVDKLKHRVVVYKSVVWLVKSYSARMNFDLASAVANAALHKANFPNELRPTLYAQMAANDITDENYAAAIPQLANALATTKDRHTKARYAYIIAQLYHLIKKDDKSSEYYKRVLTFKPGTEMEFYAKINLAKSYNNNGHQNAMEIIALLEKMAANKHYIEYRDQIYYQIGEIYAKSNDEAKAIENYRRSIGYNTTNKEQLALSYLRIANINFKHEKFIASKNEFDSSLQSLPKDNPDYADAVVKQSVLNDLIRYMHTITIEDSLQTLAKKDSRELDRYLNNYISKQKAEEEAQQQKAANASAFPDISAGTSVGGSWYFYNTTARSQGYTEFIQKWGKRPLEDNWRRSKKEANDFTSSTDTSHSKKAADTSGGNALSLEKLKKGLPLTPEKMKASDDKIIEAYYHIGIIYKEKLHSNTKAIENFEKLLTRFPGNKYELPAAYYLYLLYTASGNTAKAAYYKKLILDKYPDSDAAKLLLDPEYLNKLAQKNNEVREYYASTFAMYQDGRMQDVLQRIHEADVKYSPNPIKVKFDLLQTLAIAPEVPRDSFRNALVSFIKKYPSGEENVKANNILRLVKLQIAHDDSLKNAENIRKMTYTFNPAGSQYLIIVFNTVDKRINTLADSITNYNAHSKYSAGNLHVTTPMLTPTREMIVVKELKGDTAALNYFYAINNLKNPFKPLKGVPYNIFLTDEKGYSTLLLKKDTEEYLKFFYEKYLQ